MSHSSETLNTGRFVNTKSCLNTGRR